MIKSVKIFLFVAMLLSHQTQQSITIYNPTSGIVHLLLMDKKDQAIASLKVLNGHRVSIRNDQFPCMDEVTSILRFPKAASSEKDDDELRTLTIQIKTWDEEISVADNDLRLTPGFGEKKPDLGNYSPSLGLKYLGRE